jgi:hypothetical protein
MPPKRQPKAAKAKAAATTAAIAKANLKQDQMTFICANVDLPASCKLAFFPISGKIATMQHAWKPPISRWEMTDMQDHPWMANLRGNIGRSIISDSNVIQHLGWHNVKNLPAYRKTPIVWHAGVVDYSMTTHPTEFVSKAWLLDNPKVQEQMLPGQTLAYSLEANTTGNDGDFAAVLGYASKTALSKHSDCEGKFAIKPVGLPTPVFQLV